MIIIGITGPSGSGKGAVSEILSKFGIRVIDADAVYHRIIVPPSPCLDELVLHFGSDILNADGELDRGALAKLVFGEENKERLLLLNEITHKYVVGKIRETLSKFSLEGEQVCAIDAPLLVEAGVSGDCDFTIAVLAEPRLRAHRISARDRISIVSAIARIQSQKPDSFYIENTDVTLYNNGELSSLSQEVTRVLRERGVIS